MSSLFESISELAKRLPPGASLEKCKPPTRKADRKPPTPDLSLSAVMNQYRLELPKGKLSIEDAIALREQHDMHAAAQRYVDALFGKTNR